MNDLIQHIAKALTDVDGLRYLLPRLAILSPILLMTQRHLRIVVITEIFETQKVFLTVPLVLDALLTSELRLLCCPTR